MSLYARGFASALTAWKALLFCLGLNAVLAAALVRPVSTALHETLDHGSAAAELLTRSKAVFTWHFMRQRPDVLGDVGKWEDLVTGASGDRFLSQRGAAGSLLWMGLAYALVAGILAGGFAGRLAAEKEQASLAAFGADCGRFAFSSLFLSVLSLGLVLGLYRYVYLASAKLYTPEELRYEWEAVALTLFRLFVFLALAGYARLIVLYARAAVGLTRNGNPFLALATGAGFVLGRPARTLALEIAFLATGLLPIALWAALAPAWSGRGTLWLIGFVLLQQLVVFLRIATRAAELGTACAYLSRIRDTA